MRVNIPPSWCDALENRPYKTGRFVTACLKTWRAPGTRRRRRRDDHRRPSDSSGGSDPSSTSFYPWRDVDRPYDHMSAEKRPAPPRQRGTTLWSRRESVQPRIRRGLTPQHLILPSRKRAHWCYVSNAFAFNSLQHFLAYLYRFLRFF